MEKFAKYLRLKGMSEVTITNYASRVRYFSEGLNSEDITQDIVDKFFLGIANKSSSTVNGYIHSVSAYLKFVHRRREIKLPNRVKEIHKNLAIISEAEFEDEVIHCVRFVRRYYRYYFKTIALACLFFYADIKIEELLNLSRDDFDLLNNTVKIRAYKGKPERILNYSNRAGQAIERYFNEEREERTNAFNITFHSLKTKFYRLKKRMPYRNFTISLLQRSGKIARRTK